MKSDEERVGGVYENSGFSGRRSMNSSDGSENDVKSNASYSSRRDRRGVLLDRAEKEFEGLMLKGGDESGLRRSGRRVREGVEIEGFRGGQEIGNERKRYPGNYYPELSYIEGFENERFRGDKQTANERRKYPGEGPRNYYPESRYREGIGNEGFRKYPEESPGNYSPESRYKEGFKNEGFQKHPEDSLGNYSPESSYKEGFKNEGFRSDKQTTHELRKYPVSKYPEEGPGNYYPESSYSEGIGNEGFRKYPASKYPEESSGNYSPESSYREGFRKYPASKYTEERRGNYYPESSYREGFENEGFRKYPASKYTEESPRNYYPESSYGEGIENEGFWGDQQTANERRKYPASKYPEENPRNYYPESSYGEGIENEGFRGDQQTANERRKYPASKYPEENSRNYYPESSYSYGEPINYRSKGHGYDKVDYNGNNQAELLRKLEDLKDQLRRSGEVVDEPKGNVPHRHIKKVYHDPYNGYEDSFSDSSSGLNRPFTNVPRPSYMNHYAESSSSLPRRGSHTPPTPFEASLGYSNGRQQNKSMVSVDSFEAYPPDLNSRNLQSHSRWSSDIDSEAGGFVPRLSPRMQPRPQLSKGGRLCRPMAGGAPFLTCYKCSELLQVPNKVSVKTGPKKVRCGACSTTIIIGVSNKRLVVSVHEAAKGNHIVMSKEGNSSARSQTNRASMTVSSKNYDHSASDREPVSHLTDPPVSAKSAETGSRRSTYSLSEDEDEANGNDSDHAALQIRRSEQEMMMPRKTNSEQNFKKDASEATEMEISSNEYGHTGTSIESGEASREGNQLRGADKLAESIYGSITNSYERNEVYEEKANVTVNGHLIKDSLIKKAEKFAGPIQPGLYWYDFRAGFWGVMGGPCLGVIPPFIEEFNYPMLENCAGGNTNVFVNGRELHQKDFKLLVSRGLPSERNRCFIVEISGRVLDEYTGEELESLGKLAPSVELAKRGFGMKPPKVVA